VLHAGDVEKRRSRERDGTVVKPSHNAPPTSVAMTVRCVWMQPFGFSGGAGCVEDCRKIVGLAAAGKGL